MTGRAVPCGRHCRHAFRNRERQPGEINRGNLWVARGPGDGNPFQRVAVDILRNACVLIRLANFQHDRGSKDRDRGHNGRSGDAQYLAAATRSKQEPGEEDAERQEVLHDT